MGLDWAILQAAGAINAIQFRKMAGVTASVRIRPIRFAFMVDPRDASVLREVFRANTVLWGGEYNFIVPRFKRRPKRYRGHIFRAPALEFCNGLIEAFQPDFLVETKPGLAAGVRFSPDRIISIEQLLDREPPERCKYGIDVRSICAALYDDAFRFVQRHPPKVVIPHPSDRRFEALFAAVFGEFPITGRAADCVVHYKNALDANDETFAPTEFPHLFKSSCYFPLRVGAHQITTHRSGWSPDPMLFYMDEQSTYDLVEFWNLRSIGWRIKPLPASLAESMRDYCEQFIIESHKPYPPPSNAFRHASFLCSPSCSWNAMQSFVSSLKRPSSEAVTVDPRVPRLWEEWGRNADHADPQVITHESKSVDAGLSSDLLHLRTAMPDFTELARYAASQHACANVLESVPGGADVIPWQSLELKTLTRQFSDNRIWLSREGIVTTAGEGSFSRFLQAPSPINVFRAFAQEHKFTLSLSEAGKTCEQIVAALGGLQWTRSIADEGTLRLLDRLANGSLEIETREEGTHAKRRIRMESAPYSYVQEVLMRATSGDQDLAARRLGSLVRYGVLKLGMRIKCTECTQRSWYNLEGLSSTLTCPRCMRQFEWLLDSPPRDDWSYRAFGPFAVENFAAGSYSVALALQFLSEEVATATSWIPSFTMSRADINCEADFGMFFRPTPFSHVKGPFLIFWECKTFGDFEARDFQRARSLARLFPSAILCFATLKEALSPSEKRQMSGIVRRGRVRWRTGQQKNPVLVLTRLELFGQFKMSAFTDDYGTRAKHAQHVFARRDLEELCDFTQQVHLGMESYHSWLDKKRSSRVSKGPPK